MWFGIVVGVIVIVFTLSATYASFDKSKYDEIIDNHVRSIVLNLKDLNREQFNKYWGSNPPGSEEDREKIIQYFSTYGELVDIKEIKAVSYRNSVSFTGEGVTHLYIYEAITNFTSGPVIFKFWLQGKNDELVTLNMNISRESSI